MFLFDIGTNAAAATVARAARLSSGLGEVLERIAAAENCERCVVEEKRTILARGTSPNPRT